LETDDTKKCTCVNRVMSYATIKSSGKKMGGIYITHEYDQKRLSNIGQKVSGVYKFILQRKFLSVTVRPSRKGDLTNTGGGHSRTSYATIRVPIKIFDSLSY